MDWMGAADVFIGGLLIAGAVRPIVTRKPLQYSVPFKGLYSAGPKLQIVFQILYLSIAAWLLFDFVSRLRGSH